MTEFFRNSCFPEVLLRRAQLGLRTVKKKKNQETKAKGKAAASRPKLRRKKSSRRVLQSTRRRKLKGLPSSGSKGKVGEYDNEERNDGEWVWDETANDYVHVSVGEDWPPQEGHDSSGGKPAGEHEGRAHRKRMKRKAAAAEQEEDDACDGDVGGKSNKSPKAKTKPKAKAKAKAPKAKCSPKPKSSPKAKAKAKAKSRGNKSSKNDEGANSPTKEDDVTWVKDWVSQVDDLEGDFSAFKAGVKALVPPSAHGFRCNIYWTTGKCGVSLRHTQSDGSKKQIDLATYGFGKSRAAQACTVAAASAAVFCQHYKC